MNRREINEIHVESKEMQPVVKVTHRLDIIYNPNKYKTISK